MEHEEEPIEAMAHTFFDQAKMSSGTLHPFFVGIVWETLGEDWKNKFRGFAAKAHQAYHQAYERNIQTGPV